MKVIICKDVEKLGKVDDIVNVKDGYARNFLIPNNLVKEYTPQNVKWLERQKQIEARHIQKQRKECEELAGRISKLSCTIPVKVSDDGKLFGSVSASDISKALKAQEIEIDKNEIDISEPIKELGIYYLTVKLLPDIEARLKVWVVKE